MVTTLDAWPERRDEESVARMPARKVVAVAMVLAMVALAFAVIAPSVFRTSSTQASGEAGSLLTLVNQARSNAGLAPLAYASDLSAIAQERASIMASSGSLSHTPDVGGRACCWTWIGENVAFAGSVQGLHDVLMSSSSHRANILNADADDVGIAVVKGGGSLWAAQVFRARSDGGRTGDADSGSRSADRTTPTTTTSGESVVQAPSLTAAQLRRIELREGIRDARERLRAERGRSGPFDPVRAAVRYSDTLGVVSD
jgi:uncharacterized protein YkwD